MIAKAEFLLEIGCEEIPAHQVMTAVNALKDGLLSGLSDARLTYGATKVYATPRRLTVAIEDLQTQQEDLNSEVSGPPVKFAFKDGVPTKAAEGFAKGLGLTVDDLIRKDTPKGEYLFATKEEKGKAARDLLPEMITTSLAKIPFKKTMRWGECETAFIRPIQWMLSLLGGELVPFSYAEVDAGTESVGHRFLAPEAFGVKNVEQYVSELENRHVVVDVAARRAQIVESATELATSINGHLKEDSELIDEVVQLVEKPVAMICEFDAKYLEIPQEVLISEMQEHQRYLPIVDAEQKLMPYFVVIGNMIVSDPEVVKNGYRRVLTARFQDGVFFFEEDQKKKLFDRVESLKNVQFHRALGSIHDKVLRIEGLAQALNVSVGNPCESDAINRAAMLAKTDLVTNMVFEFPDLQGIMGHAYAKNDGESDDVALAIEEHYMPRNAGDDLPSSDLGAIIGIADRLDTIVGIFATGKGPTGTADPYGLRRAAIAIINIIKGRGWHLSFDQLVQKAIDQVRDCMKKKSPEDVSSEVHEFVRGRLRGLLTSNEIPKDVAEATLAAGYDDFIDVEGRAQALTNLRASGDFEPIAVAFKRVANILKGKTYPEMDGVALVEPAEKALLKEVQSTSSAVTKHVEERDFNAAFAAIASLRPAVDQFFEDVMVMAEDESLRNARLGLLSKINQIFSPLADFTRLN